MRGLRFLAWGWERRGLSGVVVGEDRVEISGMGWEGKGLIGMEWNRGEVVQG